MAAIAIGVVFLGYAAAMQGWVLFKGYDVTLQQLWSPTWPPVPTPNTSKKPPIDNSQPEQQF
jgi:hypothetical protein